MAKELSPLLEFWLFFWSTNPLRDQQWQGFVTAGPKSWIAKGMGAKTRWKLTALFVWPFGPRWLWCFFLFVVVVVAVAFWQSVSFISWMFHIRLLSWYPMKCMEIYIYVEVYIIYTNIDGSIELHRKDQETPGSFDFLTSTRAVKRQGVHKPVSSTWEPTKKSDWTKKRCANQARFHSKSFWFLTENYWLIETSGTWNTFQYQRGLL